MGGWNVFRFCTALRGLGRMMILLVLGIVGVTYAVVLTNYGPALFIAGLQRLTAIPVLLLFHVLLVMALWSYFCVVFTDPGIVPPNWRPETDEESEDNDLPVDTFNHRKTRFCRRCNEPKPPRCHHCSVCKTLSSTCTGGRCVLKMDHHCVWAGNCVGALNHKYFLLFVLYSFLVTAMVIVSLLPKLIIAFLSHGKRATTPTALAITFIAFVVNLAFSLALFGFMVMHLSLVAANTTKIESYKKKTTPDWPYDLGTKKNFEQVFGMDKRYWFIPAYSEEDRRRMPELQGLDYPTRPELDAQE